MAPSRRIEYFKDLATITFVISIPIAFYFGANCLIIKQTCSNTGWLPKDVSELRSQLGQLGDFINPFLTFATVWFVLKTYRYQHAETRRHELLQALARYEDAVRTVQFVPASSNTVWTGREAFYRFFTDINSELKTVRQLSDSGPTDRALCLLADEINKGISLRAEFDDHGHRFQHAYSALLELIELDLQPTRLPLSDIELIFYYGFIVRLRQTRDHRDLRARNLIASMLKERHYSGMLKNMDLICQERVYSQ